MALEISEEIENVISKRKDKSDSIRNDILKKKALKASKK